MSDVIGIGALTKDPTPDYAAPIQQGLQTGMQLAAYQQQIAQSKQDLEIKKEQLKTQALTRAFSTLSTTAKVKSPQARKALMAASVQAFNLAGVQIDPAALDYASSDPSHQQVFAAVTSNPELLKNPEVANALFSGLQNVESTDPSFQVVNNAINNAAKERNAAAGVTGRIATTQISQDAQTQRHAAQLSAQGDQFQQKQDLAVASDRLKGAQNLKGVPINYDRLNSPDQTVREKYMAELQMQAADIAKASADYKAAGLDDKKTRTALLAKSIDARVSQAGKRLTVQQDRLKNTIAQQVSANPQLQKIEGQINNADKGLVTLNNPNLKWADLREVATDTAALLSGGSGNATVSGEARATFNSLKQTTDTWLGKIANKEVGGPGPEEIKIFRDRLSRIRNEVTHFHDVQLNKLVAGKYSSLGAQYQPVLKASFDAAKLSPEGEINLQPSKGRSARDAAISRGENPTSPPPAATPGTVAAPADLLPALRQRNATPDQIKAFYQSKGFALPEELK